MTADPSPSPVELDHLEIHVRDLPAYREFLVALFRGGDYRVLTDDGITMYRAPGGQCFELKPRAEGAVAPDRSGVCLPCIRMADPMPHLRDLGVTPHETVENERGHIHFFRDAEGVEWHVKDYPRPDPAVDW
jgi:hypothetical protein